MFINDNSKLSEKIKNDILDWTTNWVEVPNFFYDFKFPVCPYAKKARLNNETTIVVYESGSILKFINKTLNFFINEKKFKQMLIVFPPRIKYFPFIKNYIHYKNKKKLVLHDIFALCGSAINTKSKYSGIFNKGSYFIIGVNTLSDVFPAVNVLQASGYYKNWSKKHFNNIVLTRKKIYEKYCQEKNNVIS